MKKKQTHKIVDLEPISENDKQFVSKINLYKTAAKIWSLCSGFIMLNTAFGLYDIFNNPNINDEKTAKILSAALILTTTAGFLTFNIISIANNIKKFNKLNNVYQSKKEKEQYYRDKGYSDGQLLFIDTQLYNEVIEQEKQKQ